MNRKRVIEPIHFVDEYKKEDTIERKEIKASDEPELNFSCRYGSINVKLSKIPFLRHLL